MSLQAPYRPVPIDDVLLAFPADVTDLMPDMAEIPEEFHSWGLTYKDGLAGKWLAFQQRWFMKGLPNTVEVDLKEGIDGDLAFRHLKAIQGSFQPKHEHKMAAVAFLASTWFEDIRYGDEDE